MDGKLATARKVLFLLACLALAVGLAACGGGGEERARAHPAARRPLADRPPLAPGTATPSGGTVEISLWHSETASNLNAIQDLVRRFNASQSEVKVKLAFQGTRDENMAKVLASVRGGEPPTIAYLDEVRVPAPHR